MRALALSVWVSAGFVVVSLLWGIAAGSQMIVFDGVYSLAGIALSSLAVAAHRTAARGADDAYPWGRETWEPLTIIVKATALGGLCVYGSVNAVREIAHGGRDVAAASALTYAVVASLASLLVTGVLYRAARGGSDLVRAEAAEWAGDAVLSLATLAGFALAAILDAGGHRGITRYIDPGLVIFVSVVYLWIPITLFRTAFREVLTKSAPAAVLAETRRICDAVRAAHGFSESFVRASKVGSRLDLELAFVVGAGGSARDVGYFDAIRADIDAELRALDYRHSTSVVFTGERKWVDWSY